MGFHKTVNGFWQNKIKAFLHDPPDKALILFHKSHVVKMDAILNKLELKYDKRLDTSDHISSAMQRLDVPEDYRMDDARSCGAHICFKGAFKPVLKHTLSGVVENLDEIKDFVATYGYEKAIEEYGFDLNAIKSFLNKNDWKKTYFLLWRFLPEKYHHGYFMPADTRIPDHSIWDHLDVTSAISSCIEGGLCLLAVKIPAVQEFISHSRKLSDLWASSHIFSTIIFGGIKIIAEESGLDVIIYPQLRGNPMVDLDEFDGENGSFVLFNEGLKLKVITRDIKESLYVASFPNTFLSFIPASRAENIAKKVENAIKQKWREIAKEAKKLLDGAHIKTDESLWNDQIENAIEITSTWLKFFNFDKFDNTKDDVPNDLEERQKTWLDFTEDSKSYKGLKVERHGLNKYKILEGDVEKLTVDVKRDKFLDACNEIFDQERIKIIISLYEWLRKDSSHFYYLTYEILRIILAQKSRLWKAWKEKPATGKKCLICGRRNALIENDTREGYKYWNTNKWNKVSVSDQLKYTLKSGERVCAVCLTKRLYRDVFKKLFNLNDKHLPEPESTVDIAGREFIEFIRSDKDFQLLRLIDIELIYPHEWEFKEKKESSIKELESLGVKERIYKKLKKWWNDLGEPNKYYAILRMDGDRIGKTLSGETLCDFEEFLHPAFRNKIKEWKKNGKEKGKELIKTKRILTPSHHIAISRAMKDFSLHIVPKIVKEYKGFLVYAGGDDVLALFPADKALEASKKIQEYFRKDFYEIDVKGKKRNVMGLGNKTSMSAGIVFAHYKWPLYDAIEKVREAEKKAKDKYRRNAFCITFIKRSGEILTAGGKWEFKWYFDQIMDVLNPKDEGKRKLSHRFIYDFLDTLKVLRKENNEKRWEELDITMLKAEVKRLLKNKNYKKRLTENDIKRLHENVFSQLIGRYLNERLSLKDIGVLLKILYDAYRGEER